MSGPAGHSYEENSSDRAFAVCDPLSALPRNSEAHNIGNKLQCLLQLESSLHSVISFTQTLQCGSSPSHSVEHLECEIRLYEIYRKWPQAKRHTHVCNAVPLVWGSLRLTPIKGLKVSNTYIRWIWKEGSKRKWPSVMSYGTFYGVVVRVCSLYYMHCTITVRLHTL